MTINRMLLPIPDDWNGQDWDYAVVCYPKSTQWQSIVYGKIAELSRGRKWDGNTGTITEAQAIGLQILENTCMACGDDFKRLSDAMYIDVNGQEKSITQVLYDASQASNISFQDLIDELDSSVADANDYIELLGHIKDVLPGLPGLPAISVFAIWRSMVEARYRHSDLTLKAYGATSLRHIGNALAPILEDQETEEDSVKDVLGDLSKIPWLTTAIISLVDPSPAGEVAFVAKMAISAKSLYDKVTGAWATFRDTYINQVSDPQPVSSVVGQLADIAARLSNAGGNININLSDCEDCGPETGGGSTGETPATMDYKCLVAQWYLGLIIDRLWGLIRLQYTEDEPQQFEDTPGQWVDSSLQNVITFLNARSSLLFSGEILNDIETESEYPITEPQTVYINDWGNQLALDQNGVNSLYQLVTFGITRKETGQIYNPARDNYIDTKVDVNYRLNLMEYLTNILDHQQDILDAIVWSNSASEARSATVAVFEASISPPFLDGGTEYKPARRKFSDLLTAQGVFNRMYSSDVSQADIDNYSWRVEAECQFNFDCMPRTGGMTYGLPNPWATGSWDLSTYPVLTWVTITSQFDDAGGPASNQKINPVLDDQYELEFEILSIPNGMGLLFQFWDCDFNPIHSQTYFSPQVVGNFTIAQANIKTEPSQATNPGTFQIRIRRLS